MTVVVLQTHIQGKTLTLHDDPTPEQIEGFVQVQNDKYRKKIPGVVDERGRELPAYGILSARRFDSLQAVKTHKGKPVKVAAALAKNEWPTWAQENS